MLAKTIWEAVRRGLPGCEGLRGLTSDSRRRVTYVGKCYRVIKDNGEEVTVLWTDNDVIKEIPHVA